MKQLKAHNKKQINEKSILNNVESICRERRPRRSEERNTQKGITLIALIITIIVLLILAIVSIRLVVNNGILGKAEYATQKYSEEEAAEQEKLLKVEYEMAKYEGKFSGTYPEYVIDKKYPGVKIGDYVAYNEAGFGTYTADTSKGIGGFVGTKDSTTGKCPLTEKTYTTEDLGWRVLGVNAKGELELISDNPMSSDQKVYLANEEGYLNAETVGDKKGTLDTFCNTLYGNGTGSTGKVVASGARSLNVDDIEKLGGITTDEQKKKISSNYGVEWQYRYPTRDEAKKTDENVSPKGENDTLYMQYKKATDTKWTDITSDSCQKFRLPGESETIGKISATEIKEGSRSVKYTYYNYAISNYVKQTTSDGKSMADIITKGTGSSNVSQWLASPYVYCGSISADFGLHDVGDGYVNNDYLFGSYGRSGSSGYRVRPVVFLKSDIQIDKTETNDGSTLAKACIIK